jgi:glutamate dehydrogenase/leucine dehydrogenase
MSCARKSSKATPRGCWVWRKVKAFVALLDDILFLLNAISGAGRIADWEAEFAGEIGRHIAGFAQAEIAPLDEPGDAQGCHSLQMVTGLASSAIRTSQKRG